MAETLRDIIIDAMEPGVFGDSGKPNLDPFIERDDGPLVRRLCSRYGYGGMLYHIEALWREWATENGLDGAEHTVAACRSVRNDWIKRAKKALEASDG